MTENLMQTILLRVLVVGDAGSDLTQLPEELAQAGFDLTCERVETLSAMRAALERWEWDLALADDALPDFGAAQALALIREHGRDIPLIVVSEAVGEEAVAAVMRAGAADFLLKGHPGNLAPAILRGLTGAAGRRERRLAEAALRASERFAWSALDGLSAGIAILDSTGVILAVNRPWRRFAEENCPVSLDVAEGVSYLSVCDKVTGPDAEAARRAAQGIREVAGGARDLYTIEYPCHSPERQRWFHLRVTRFLGDGPVRVLVSHEDITERWEAEEALRRLNQTLQEKESRLTEAQRVGRLGDWELDLVTGERVWSEQLYRLCGLDPGLGPPTEALHRACYHPDDLHLRDEGLAEMLATRQPSEMDMRLVRPGGEIRWCHLTAQPILDDAGQLVRVVGTLADITEQKVREQQIQDANTVLEVQKSQLEAANAELAALATTDPLTGLLNHHAFHRRLEDQARVAQEAVRLGRGDGRAAAVALLDMDDFRFFNDAYGHAVGDQALRQVAARLRSICGTGDAVARFGGDEFTLLLPDVGLSTTPAQIEARLRSDLDGLSYQPPGESVPIPITLAVGVALLPEDDAGRAEALRLAEERLRRAKSGGDTETEADRVRASAVRSLSGFSMLDALVTAVDNKDRYTRRHSEDVMGHSLTIARQLGLDNARRDTIAVAALLHDVGKIGVPDAILRKPGRLTDEEFEAIKQHPMMGSIIVQSIPGLEETLDAVRHHHERWDGGGYPFGLRGEETPLTARLMAVADAFSAMTTDRPYRKGMDRDRALAILMDGAGTQWDPRCVSAFLEALKSGGVSASQGHLTFASGVPHYAPTQPPSS